MTGVTGQTKDLTTDAVAKRGRRLKNYTLIAGLALSGLTLLTWTGQWYSLQLTRSEDGHPTLAITGDVAAPGLVALALAGLALVAALAIAGRFFRIVLGVLEALIGFTIALSAILAEADPISASEAAISAATGVGGKRSVADLVSSVSQTAYPVIAIVVGVALFFLGIAILVTGHRWPGSSNRYRQPVRLAPLDDDAFDSGDPLEPESTKRGQPADSAAADPEAADPAADAVSDWDSLSGGADPTSR